MILNGWHSDRTGERRWHITIPLVIAGVMFLLLIEARHNISMAVLFLLLGNGVFYAFYPAFWAIPTMLLSESAAAATFGLINSAGQCGGFAGPYVIGLLNDRTHSLTASFAFIGLVYLAAAAFTMTLNVRNPLER
jgi:ACS family tartrate transporter-like MFS transporter